METRDRKARNFIQTNFFTLLWHGLPVAALVIWGAFCITNNLWYDEAYSASMVSLPWKRLICIIPFLQKQLQTVSRLRAAHL